MIDGEHIENLVGSDGWKLAKQRLFEKLVQMDSIDAIANLDIDPLEIKLELKARKHVINLVRDWISDIEGTAQQSHANKQPFYEERKETIVQIFE